jgi:hypothetical protein
MLKMTKDKQISEGAINTERKRTIVQDNPTYRISHWSGMK